MMSVRRNVEAVYAFFKKKRKENARSMQKFHKMSQKFSATSWCCVAAPKYVAKLLHVVCS
jgi:hypothetical protein